MPPVVPDVAEVSLRTPGEVRDLSLAGLSPAVMVGSRPWRMFRGYRGQRHYSGSYWSVTMGGHVIYESRLELARLLLADQDRSVVAIYAQPFLMRASVQGRVRRHVPDYLLVGDDDSITVVDVKPAHRLDDERVAEVLRWAGGEIRALGWGYEVSSEPEPTVLENLRFTAGYRRTMGIDPGLCAQVLAHAGPGGPTPIRGIELALAEQAPAERVRAHVLHLLWHGRLNVDWTAPLDSASRVAAAS